MITQIPGDQATKVYAAETLVRDGQHFRSLTELDEWLQSLVRRSWFRRRYPQLLELVVYDGRGRDYARGWLDNNGIGRIHIPRPLRYQLVAIHELAHAVGNHNHNARFCADYLSLARWAMGRQTWNSLRIGFNRCGVRFRMPPKPKFYSFDFMGKLC